MPKIETLKKRKDFIRVTARGHRFVTPAFVVQATPHPQNADITRVGYTASKKVGSAVCRNRAKRRLRALVRELLPENSVPSSDYVLVARGYVLNRSYDRMRKEMLKALKDYQEMIRG